MTTAPPIVIEKVPDIVAGEELERLHLMCHCSMFQALVHHHYHLLCGLKNPPNSMSTPTEEGERCVLCEHVEECPACECRGGRAWVRVSNLG